MASSRSDSNSVENSPWAPGEAADPALTLDSVRDTLIRMEDTIIFSLIERARHPYNHLAYDAEYSGGQSLVHLLVRETESVYSVLGRYQNPEEIPFFPNDLSPSRVPPYNHPQVLHPAADAAADISQTVWDMYFNDLLPLFTVKGDDGNYASAALLDLVCLQALSRRIHYGRFVAEVKFRDAPEDYGAAIRAQDRDALMKMLTFERVEEMVKRRVEKKAMVFGQDVTLDDNSGPTGDACYKIDPSVVSRLYNDWAMPLTKLVEVEYLLRRLD